MEEGASHSSVSGSTHTIPNLPENPDFLMPSFSPSSAPSSPKSTGTPTRLGIKSPPSPSAGASSGSPGGQVSAITVVALLDKLVNMMESVQDNQQRMEQRQCELEGAVRIVQGDVTRLSKNHVSTSNCVGKLLERSRKVSDHLKDVKERLDKQAVQVKKLEANHSHLLKRNHFKVLIFQEDNEIPSTVLVKDSVKTPQQSQYDAESTHPTPSVTGSVDAIRTQDEVFQKISLSSDELDDATAVQGLDVATGYGDPVYERRADKFKRSSLKKVDSLKRAFSRQTIEKRMSQISTRIVPPARREQIKKSFTPNLPKSPTAKTSSFKVPPMTFNVSKFRDEELPLEDKRSPSEEAHVDIPPIGSLDGNIPLAEVHTHESSSTSEDTKAALAINGESPITECEINGKPSAGLAVPEPDEDIGEDVEEEGGEGEEKEEEGKQKGPAEMTADAQIPTATIAVNQVS